MNSSTEDSSQDTQESGSAGPDQRQFETTLEDIKALRQQSVEGLQQQLQRTFEDLRTLGVQVGAVSPDQKLRVASKTQILISAATYALVRDQVKAEPVPALRLKGITEAVAAYQILGLR